MSELWGLWSPQTVPPLLGFPPQLEGVTFILTPADGKLLRPCGRVLMPGGLRADPWVMALIKGRLDFPRPCHSSLDD